MKTLLWLDDLRDPFTESWLEDYAPSINPKKDKVIWVTSYYAFVRWITQNGIPDMVAFDHDLGEDIAKVKVSHGVSKRQARREKKGTPTGYDAAKWLVDYCIDNEELLPAWTVQSANPVGAENINKYLINYLKS